MANRIDVSTVQNLFHDSQRISQEDLDIEQTHNNQNDAAIINNHFGSGILLDAPQQPILFDSDDLDITSAALLASLNFDGTGIQATQQPSDINLGNQLEVELTGSTVFGRLSTKVAIIGLGFDNTVQMDRLFFYRNEKQVTSKHYKKILCLFFCDFKGNTACSRNNGGRIVIREAASFQLSADPIMIAQDVEPDLFWRDFKLASLGGSLFDAIQTGMGAEFSVDALNINVTQRENKTLISNDVVTQIGQKFLAKTNNIQKITLLLGVSEDLSGTESTKFDWTGDLIISVYPLQTSVSCPTDIVPGLAIDFDPSSDPIAQLSVNQNTLKDWGYVLNDVLQPIDFVFSATKIAQTSSKSIVPGNYYAVTIKRSGAATSGMLLVGVGGDHTEDSRATMFNNVWVDIPDEDLWFQVYTDAAKISSGEGYDNGNGMMLSKTSTDLTTGATIDNSAAGYSFVDTGINVANTGVLQAIESDTETIQDERTGNNVFSRKQFVPSFSFVNDSSLAQLEQVGNPLLIGVMKDTNPKLNPTLTKTQTYPGLGKGDTFTIINPDADLLSLNLLGSQLIPNTSASTKIYKIYRETLCVNGYGDVNGDGLIDDTDLALASSLIGESLLFSSTQQKIIDGTFTTLQILRADVDGDGYVTSTDVDLLTNYINRSINSFPAGSSFNSLLLEVQGNIGRFDGYYDCGNDGYIRLDAYVGLNIIDADSLDANELIYDGYEAKVLLESDPIFTQTPFTTITYSIIPQPFWQPYGILTNSDARLVACAFTNQNEIVKPDSTPPTHFSCRDPNLTIPEFDPGRNDFFVPDNLYIKNGEILRSDGSFYKIDFEIGTIILELPAVPLSESSINIFDKFVADRGDGFTRSGYPALRYACGSTVQPEDLALNRVKFDVSLQAINKNTDGYSAVDGYGVISDDIIGVFMDQTTSILKLTIKDLATDPVYMTLVSKIQIQVLLKKGGWNNPALIVPATEIIGLIS